MPRGCEDGVGALACSPSAPFSRFAGREEEMLCLRAKHRALGDLRRCNPCGQRRALRLPTAELLCGVPLRSSRTPPEPRALSPSATRKPRGLIFPWKSLVSYAVLDQRGGVRTCSVARCVPAGSGAGGVSPGHISLAQMLPAPVGPAPAAGEATGEPRWQQRCVLASLILLR